MDGLFIAEKCKITWITILILIITTIVGNLPSNSPMVLLTTSLVLYLGSIIILKGGSRYHISRARIVPRTSMKFNNKMEEVFRDDHIMARNFMMRANADGLGKALSVDNCGLYFEKTKSRIIGGTDAQRGTNPWIAAMFQDDKSERLVCAGSIINNRWVCYCFLTFFDQAKNYAIIFR